MLPGTEADRANGIKLVFIERPSKDALWTVQDPDHGST